MMEFSETCQPTKQANAASCLWPVTSYINFIIFFPCCDFNKLGGWLLYCGMLNTIFQISSEACIFPNLVIQ